MDRKEVILAQFTMAWTVGCPEAKRKEVEVGGISYESLLSPDHTNSSSQILFQYPYEDISKITAHEFFSWCDDSVIISSELHDGFREL